MADEIFENTRLAEIYDLFDPDRSDLEAYEWMVNEFRACSVLDIGCGTGTLACRLADKGIEVIGLDPALWLKRNMVLIVSDGSMVLHWTFHH
ncbi:hypothetical protein BACCIP111883_03483 [Sutcliffiella rhizosphaerae]|uniref:Class I SAM-dependent methyltransferase n=1 Tax=Sutcliffiella rhizosphaerae TaxID=2880967 RepID=A0ABM8YS59_9BACI|nr:hypothetical protein BACCIP111883_03483 [Sutcliffiella rhizosphaerae]